MKAIKVHVQEPYLRALNNLVQQGLYPNSAEAIRLAIRDLLLLHGKGRLVELQEGAKQ